MDCLYSHATVIEIVDDSSGIDLKRKPDLAVVLIEPRIPQNAGNIGRLCACAGALFYVVGDLGFRIGDKYLRRAGMDYLDDIELTHLPDFNAVQARHPDWTSVFVETQARQSYTDMTYKPGTLLVFGNETTGLPLWVMERYPERSVRIPMMPEARSLNLGNSVAIVLYEAIRQLGCSHP